MKRIKKGDLMPWFLQDHGQLPQWYLDDTEKFFKWLEKKTSKPASVQARKLSSGHKMATILNYQLIRK